MSNLQTIWNLLKEEAKAGGKCIGPILADVLEEEGYELLAAHYRDGANHVGGCLQINSSEAAWATTHNILSHATLKHSYFTSDSNLEYDKQLYALIKNLKDAKIPH